MTLEVVYIPVSIFFFQNKTMQGGGGWVSGMGKSNNIMVESAKLEEGNMSMECEI